MQEGMGKGVWVCVQRGLVDGSIAACGRVVECRTSRQCLDGDVRAYVSGCTSIGENRDRGSQSDMDNQDQGCYGTPFG
eukprot:3238833-Pyramimonas_sp.AAC.1